MNAAQYLEFGMPPIGESADICPGATIPDQVVEIIGERFEASYPGVYILGTLIDGLFCLNSRTAAAGYRHDQIKRVILEPNGPAKGPGFVLISFELDGGKISKPILGSSFSSSMVRWMEEKAEAIALMLLVPYRRLPLGADA